MQFVSSALDRSTLMRKINIFLVPIKAMPNLNLSKLPFILQYTIYIAESFIMSFLYNFDRHYWLMEIYNKAKKLSYYAKTGYGDINY